VRHAARPGNDKPDLDPAAIATVRIDFAERTETTLSLGVLALYNLSDGVRFLDAVDDGLSRWTSFLDRSVLTLSNGEIVLLAQSTNSTASESYMFTLAHPKSAACSVTTYFTLGWQSCAGSVD